MAKDTARIIILKEMPTGGSDLTLKQDVRSVNNVLSKVLALRPVSWRWKAAGKNSRLRYGFIAQEVEKIFPDIISEEPWQGDGSVKGDGTMRKHIASTDLLPYLVGAIIEQQDQINELHKCIDSMRK